MSCEHVYRLIRISFWFIFQQQSEMEKNVSDDNSKIKTILHFYKSIKLRRKKFIKRSKRKTIKLVHQTFRSKLHPFTYTKLKNSSMNNVTFVVVFKRSNKKRTQNE